MDPAKKLKGLNHELKQASLTYIVFLRYDVTISETTTELQGRESIKQKWEKKIIISFKYKQ